jgi:hypothetical protein
MRTKVDRPSLAEARLRQANARQIVESSKIAFLGFFGRIGRNPLKNHDSHEGIQGNPRKSKSFRLGIPSFSLGLSL